jgi:hypothetical protein
MEGKRASMDRLQIIFTIFILFFPTHSPASEDHRHHSKCVDRAFERVVEIRSLPEEKYLHTLDGQEVLLSSFFTACRRKFPISTLCPQRYDPHKTHGDVVEFYDGKGQFMGLSVYMGDGKYCPLPYDAYHQ